MKKVLLFFGGFIVGVISTLAVGFAMDNEVSSNNELPGLTSFGEKGDCITKSKIEIFQVIKPNISLGETAD